MLKKKSSIEAISPKTFITNENDEPTQKENIKVDDTLKRLTEFAQRQKEIETFKKNKQELDEQIKSKGGLTFDKNAQIINSPEKKKNELAREQLELIDKWCTNSDPLIPLHPEFKDLFDWSFENSEFNQEWILNNGLLDINNFSRYFNQIKKDADRETILNQLFFYATSTTNDYRNNLACDILVFILDACESQDLKWKVGAIQFFEILCNLGLNLEKFHTNCSHLIDYLKENCQQNLSLLFRLESRTQAISTNKDWSLFGMTLDNLLSILTLTLTKSSKLYDESELDFLFCLMTYTLLDVKVSTLQLNLSFKMLLSELLNAYDGQTWSRKKHELCENLICMNGDDYYSVIYINEYFEQSDQERIMELAYEIALVVALNLMNFNIEQIEDIQSSQIDILLFHFKTKSTAICAQSSLKMFILLKCIELIINELVSKKCPNVFEYLNRLKDTLTLITKQVRDKVELQGRHQVKVKISYLINTCNYHLNTSEKWKLKLIQNDMMDVTINSTIQDIDDPNATSNVNDSSLLPNIG